ncbi:putative MAPEG superfamily protein [Luteibacter rhizovicinus]|uniref:Putative MAPEG superfamily protein n=1 Tax=Luteibacter rhizovicinus TaxID=242606 RepID=A0A4R3YYC9_9GAMM|nr:MAPEG family protein [Luteibacter rhizovicinus]TCV96363.1 putative MAPEG superfamily protein [Luteibacter rhizovicinus]
MPIELKMLGWSVLLGLVYIVVATGLGAMQRGLAWNASNRDGSTPALTGAAARADRAVHNLLETFVFFAAAVLTVVLAQRTSPATALGVQLFFWARLVYLPVYIIGIPYLRTLIWAVSIWGIVQVLAVLF